VVTALEINVAGIDVMARQLARYIDRVDDLRPALHRIARNLAAHNAENFDTEGVTGVYGRWAPLSPKYRAWKEKHYPGKPILVRTGALRRELTGSPLGIEDVTTRSIRMGTNVPYARYHQTGTHRMPRRQPVSLNEQMRRDMVKTLQRFCQTGSVD
jgi:phage gpG-like protein